MGTEEQLVNDTNANFKETKAEIENIKKNYTPLEMTNKINEIIDNVNTTTSAKGSGIPTSICFNLRMEKSGTTVKLKWNDPDDTVIEGQTLCTWAKTIIVRKEGEYPTSETDGTAIVTNTVRNLYENTALVDTLPDSTNKYYYRAFPISANGVACYDEANKFNGAIIYEFAINPANSNCYGKIEYRGRNANFRSAKMDFSKGVFDYGDWKNAFFMKLFKPVMLKKSGVVDYELNPYNMKQKLDGTASDATNTSYAGNVMVQIGQIWINEENVNGLQIVRIANQKINDNYDCKYCVNEKGNLAPYYYRSKYDACNIKNGTVDEYRSISGQAPAGTLSGVTQIERCQANGDGWNIQEESFLRLMRYLLMLIGHSTDFQSVFGTGRSSGGSSKSPKQLASGLNDDKGMFYGDDSNGTVTVFFIDNLWGNVWKITNGVINKTGELYYKLIPPYNTDGTGYTDTGVACGTSLSEAYIKDMKLIPGIGLVPSVYTGGSATTFYPDGIWSANVIGMMRAGGSSASGSLCGGFACAVDNVASHSTWTFGSALTYKSPL